MTVLAMIQKQWPDSALKKGRFAEVITRCGQESDARLRDQNQQKPEMGVNQQWMHHDLHIQHSQSGLHGRRSPKRVKGSLLVR